MYSRINPDFIAQFNSLGMGGLYELGDLDGEDFDILLDAKQGRTMGCGYTAGEKNNGKWYDAKYVMALFDLTSSMHVSDSPFEDLMNSINYTTLGRAFFRTPFNRRSELFKSIGGCGTYGITINLRTGAMNELSKTNGKGWRKF